MARDDAMPSTVRLKPEEQDQLRKKSIEINKILIMNDHAPVSESELVHILIEKTVMFLKATKDGKILIDL